MAEISFNACCLKLKLVDFDGIGFIIYQKNATRYSKAFVI